MIKLNGRRGEGKFQITSKKMCIYFYLKDATLSNKKRLN